MSYYTKIDQRLHQLCQIIAKANRTYVPKKVDDSHTNLYYDILHDRIVGRWIETPKGRRLLTLNLSTFYFEWLNDALQVQQMIAIEGRTTATIEADLEKEIKRLGLNTEGFRAALHFEIPNYSFANQAIEALEIKALEEWKRYRILANEVCARILGHLQVEGETRIWPHHFDTGIYVLPNKKVGIGLGLAMEDTLHGAPYFYIAGYPTEGTLNFSNTPQLAVGKWIKEGNWKGGTLPITALNGLNERELKNTVSDFYKVTMAWYLDK